MPLLRDHREPLRRAGRRAHALTAGSPSSSRTAASPLDLDVVAADMIEEVLARHPESVDLGARAAPVVGVDPVRLVTELAGDAERRQVVVEGAGRRRRAASRPRKPRCSVAIRISVPSPRPWKRRPSHDPVSNVRVTGKPAAIEAGRCRRPCVVLDHGELEVPRLGRVSARVPPVEAAARCARAPARARRSTGSANGILPDRGCRRRRASPARPPSASSR